MRRKINVVKNAAMVLAVVLAVILAGCVSATPPYVTPDSWVLTDDLPAIRRTLTEKEDEPIIVTHKYRSGSYVFKASNTRISGNSVILKRDTVASLKLLYAFAPETVATYEMDVKVSEVIEAGWNALYFGLRLQSDGADATNQNGIWIALRKNQIGMRIGDWPITDYLPPIKNDFDFSAESHHLVIRDDMERNIITVSCEDNGKEPFELCTVKIENDKINMYAPGATKPALSDKIKGTIAGNGFFYIWLHHTKTDAIISDFIATGTAYKKPTAERANMMNSRDIFEDTWVATDDENRSVLPGNGSGSEKKVGIFYFLWHDTNDPFGNNPLFDHSKAFYEGGIDALRKVMTEGNIGYPHYWAEPYFGYYRSNDEWVIRRHTMMLTSAGVDFWFIDATNGLTYERNYETILKVWSEMRAEGYKTPTICFHCGNNPDVAPNSFFSLWNNLYSVGRYKDFWFMHDGKPLIFLPESLENSLSKNISEFFTIRHSWANTSDSWYQNTEGRKCWPWADMYPQRPGLSEDGKKEQMIVMSGFWVNGSFGTNAGRSFRNGKQPSLDKLLMGFDLVNSGTSGKGYGFEEQFNHAIKRNPELIMLVGWNEWWAGRWEAGAALGQTIANSYQVVDDDSWMRNYFVDNFNPEFSRDIEPVKGFYNDNYYYQMAQNIRDYKGARNIESAFGRRPIDMNGSLGQWFSVGPEFRDYTGDTKGRDEWSFVGNIHYVNDTGRNDFSTMKVSKYGDDVWFYAECADDITAPEGTNWMNLFINADCSQSTGWYGYDYVINRSRDNETCSIMKFVDNSWKMIEVGRAGYVVSGNTIQIHVKASLLKLKNTFDFKWADNSVDDGDIMKFIDIGDTAPNDRFSYRYTTAKTTSKIPSCLDKDMIVLKAGSYNAFAGRKEIMLDSSNTKAIFTGDENHIYCPLEFVRDVIGIEVSENTTYNHFGVIYVDAAEAIEKSGKIVTKSADGSLLVIGSRAVSEDEALILYRSLH